MLLNLKSNINRNIAKRVLGSSLKKTKRAKTDMPKLFSCQKSIPLLSELLMKRIESVMGFGYKWIKFIEKSGWRAVGSKSSCRYCTRFYALTLPGPHIFEPKNTTYHLASSKIKCILWERTTADGSGKRHLNRTASF